jgi:predicted cupin superfamily sugar epimerase
MSLDPTVQALIAALELQPHPLEGGYFRETYRSADRLPAHALPARYGREKSAGTAIYYLLTPDSFSALHRLPTDEIFHFYWGDPVLMLQLEPTGNGRVVLLGPDVLAGQSPQVIVPRGVWQGSCLAPGGRFALLGTTLAPGFDYSDYEAGDGERLAEQYPSFADLIHRLSR